MKYRKSHEETKVNERLEKHSKWAKTKELSRKVRRKQFDGMSTPIGTKNRALWEHVSHTGVKLHILRPNGLEPNVMMVDHTSEVKSMEPPNLSKEKTLVRQVHKLMGRSLARTEPKFFQ